MLKSQIFYCRDLGLLGYKRFIAFIIGIQHQIFKSVNVSFSYVIKLCISFYCSCFLHLILSFITAQQLQTSCKLILQPLYFVSKTLVPYLFLCWPNYQSLYFRQFFQMTFRKQSHKNVFCKRNHYLLQSLSQILPRW